MLSLIYAVGMFILGYRSRVLSWRPIGVSLLVCVVGAIFQASVITSNLRSIGVAPDTRAISNVAGVSLFGSFAFFAVSYLLGFGIAKLFGINKPDPEWMRTVNEKSDDPR